MPVKDPFKEIEEMQKKMNKLMKNFWERGPKAAGTMRGFPVDLRDENGNLIIEADLPGVDKEDVVVKTRENQLMISCQEESKKEVSEETYYRRERSKRGMERTITLPEEVKPEKAEAEMKDGVLKITIPKKKVKKKKEKEIDIE